MARTARLQANKRAKTRTIKGEIFSGLKQGAFFTQLNWVREECLQKLDFIPFPGTLNLKVQDEYIGIVRELRMNAGVVLTPPSPEFCQAKCFPVSLGSIKAAIIFPEADRFTDQLHAGNIIEIIAPVSIKRTLSVKDGDELVLELEG